MDIGDEVKQLAKQYSLLSDKDKELVKNMINSLSEKIGDKQATEKWL